jgi:hypothetical protein
MNKLRDELLGAKKRLELADEKIKQECNLRAETEKSLDELIILYDKEVSKNKELKNRIKYECPVCLEETSDLVSFSCGHIVCSNCSKGILKERNCCICRSVFTHDPVKLFF